MPTYTELLPKTKSEKHGALVWEPAADNAISPVAGILTLTGTRSYCRYKVSEFPADMTGRAFMLEKLSAGSDATEERYACLLGPHGSRQCDCKGFASAGSCKHLVAIGELLRAEKL